MSTAAFRKLPVGGIEHRFADIKSSSYDSKARTVEATLSTGAAVKRAYGNEVLLITPAAVNLERLTTCGIPLIDSHNIFSVGSVFGRVARVWFDAGQLIGLLSFDDSDIGRMAEGLVSRGTVRGISIGYRVNDDDWEVTDDEGDKVDPSRLRWDGEYTFTARRFELLEVSLTSVPADPNAFVRSFESSPPIGADGAATVRARMGARMRIALTTSSTTDDDASITLHRRRPIYPGGGRFWRGG
jgi:Caudovirus prohead serine protease